MTTELKPCPSCGGECIAPRTLLADDGHAGLPSVNCASWCGYTSSAKTRKEAIERHNSIPRGEKCRMEIPDDEDLEGFLQCSVCKELVVDDRNRHNFCPNCGKEIEEINE